MTVYWFFLTSTILITILLGYACQSIEKKIKKLEESLNGVRGDICSSNYERREDVSVLRDRIAAQGATQNAILAHLNVEVSVVPSTPAKTVLLPINQLKHVEIIK